MRKILALTICTICLSFSTSVHAQENVTNQLEEIIGQLENLDQVLDFLVANQEYLQYFVDGGFWVEEQKPLLLDLISTTTALKQALLDNIAPDVDNISATVDLIASDVAALTADVAVFVSQIVESINGVTYELVTFQNALYQQLYLIQFLLTKPQLDESLSYFLYQLDNNSSMLATYRTTLNEILQSIQSLDFSDSVADALYNISIALDNLGQINVVIDLAEELEKMDLFVNVDLGAALEGLETNLSSVLDSTEHISYLFEVFINLFSLLKENQQLTNDQVRAFLTWYKDYFFPGLQNVLTAQSVWLERQGIREDAEGKFRDDLEQFLTYDAEMPTDSDVPYVAQLEEAGLEEPEVPDEKIYSAVDSVETDLEDVEHELTGALDIVDESFKGLLNSINLRWGSFNPILSFSFKPPLKGSNYEMKFSYNFANSELLAPCKAASTGVWGIILFVESFLAISATFSELIDN